MWNVNKIKLAQPGAERVIKRCWSFLLKWSLQSRSWTRITFCSYCFSLLLLNHSSARHHCRTPVTVGNAAHLNQRMKGAFFPLNVFFFFFFWKNPPIIASPSTELWVPKGGNSSSSSISTSMESWKIIKTAVLPDLLASNTEISFLKYCISHYLSTTVPITLHKQLRYTTRLT